MHELMTQRELPTVLLIDDDLVSREVAATMLTLSGYTVYAAESGEAALGKLGSKGCNPAVILMDAQMPGLSGRELIRELRFRTKAVVVVISGSESGDDVARFADGFLMKPFDAAALADLLEKRAMRPAIVARKKTGEEEPDPVVSTETLAQLRGLMPEEGIREIYTAVAADLETRMAELETAIANRDLAAVRRIGHAIKGGCGMAGALQAARLGAMLEALSDEPAGNHLDNSARLLNDLRSAARNLERILTSELPV
ncbi:MAG TPA: response regulator [Terracidiphilus sp.]|nr:response regulator [Terracidiphilus sp.]